MPAPSELASDLRRRARESRRASGTSSTDAYEDFVRAHCSRLVRSLTLVTLDPELAADAAQDAFLQLYLHWEKVKRHEAPEAWLYRVGINRCRDYGRSLGRATRLDEAPGDLASARK